MGVKAWITVNGVHIPIMEGESKAAAVGRFIKGKRKDRIAKEKSRRENEHFDYFADETHRVSKELDHVYKKGELDDDTKYNYSHEIAHNRAEDYMRKKYGENWKEGKQTIRGRAKTEYEKAKAYADSLPDVDDRKSRNSLLTSKESAYIKAGKIKDKQKNSSYKLSPRNSFSPKVSRALTKLDTNKGVRIDGKAWKKVGPDKFMNENGFKIDKWQMANEISKAKEVKYYKRWED